jgi:hypothetical protein
MLTHLSDPTADPPGSQMQSSQGDIVTLRDIRGGMLAIDSGE